jgi:hypothetical protein
MVNGLWVAAKVSCKFFHRKIVIWEPVSVCEWNFFAFYLKLKS